MDIQLKDDPQGPPSLDNPGLLVFLALVVVAETHGTNLRKLTRMEPSEFAIACAHARERNLVTNTEDGPNAPLTLTPWGRRYARSQLAILSPLAVAVGSDAA